MHENLTEHPQAVEEQEKSQTTAGTESRKGTAGSPVSVRLPSNGIVNAQMRQRFVDLHYGPHDSPPRIFSLLGDGKKAANLAMSVLCVAQLATTFRDASLAKTSQLMYCETIRRLNHEINVFQQTRQGCQLEDIACAVDLLVPCSWFSCVSTGATEWISHWQGFMRMLRDYDLETIRPALRTSFYCTWKRPRSLDSLRLRSVVKQPVSSNRAPLDLQGSLLQESASRAPYLLGQTDRVIQACQTRFPEQHTVLSLIAEISKLVATLKQWQLLNASQLPLRWHLVSVKTFRHFGSLCGTHLDTLPTAYSFTQSAHELDLRVSIMCLMRLQQSVIAIYDALPEGYCAEGKDALELNYRLAREDVAMCADSLCMLIPYITRPPEVAWGYIHSSHALNDAKQCYKQLGQQQRLAWCEQISRAIEAKGIRIPRML